MIFAKVIIIKNNLLNYVIMDCSEIGCIAANLRTAYWLWHCTTSREVQGSIPGGVTGGIFSVVPPDKTMCPGVDSALGNEYQGLLLG